MLDGSFSASRKRSKEANRKLRLIQRSHVAVLNPIVFYQLRKEPGGQVFRYFDLDGDAFVDLSIGGACCAAA